ncbi:BRICHOS domain-containing protein 5 [Erythrolamprus reginae]|uniref:BRICHOS domain-containing protein 5 n=1 Tax=Erythrolamprus reginae TaxID=121349 RepID=UPI00396CA120
MPLPRLGIQVHGSAGSPWDILEFLTGRSGIGKPRLRRRKGGSGMEEQAVAHLSLSAEKPPPAESHRPSRIFGAILSIMLTCGIICITVAATVSFTQVSPKPLSQVMRLNFQNRPGSSMNQSIVISKAKKTITYYITSSSNQSTAILFDCKNGYVCYKLSGHSNCYLKRMNAQDQEAAQAAFNLSKHKEDPPLLPSHASQYYQEFLGVVPGSLVQPVEAGEAARTLCQQVPIRWVKKKDDPPKQRLIYLCIDICFPNNVCVSICFYYLPE